jgi:hypothetical protein
VARARSNGLSAPVVVVATGLKCQTAPGRAVEVGERFRSIAWAECSTGISKSHIVGQLSGRVKHARGVVFAYDGGAA